MAKNCVVCGEAIKFGGGIYAGTKHVYCENCYRTTGLGDFRQEIGKLPFLPAGEAVSTWNACVEKRNSFSEVVQRDADFILDFHRKYYDQAVQDLNDAEAEYKIKKNMSNVVITTTPSVEGRKIKKYLQLVSFDISINEPIDSINESLQRLAVLIGADAIVGVKFFNMGTISLTTNGDTVVAGNNRVYGTAVVLE